MCVDMPGKPRHQEQAAQIAVAPTTDASGGKLDYEAFVDKWAVPQGHKEWGWGKTKQFYGSKEGYGKYIYQTFGKGDLSLVPLVGGGTAKTAADAAKELLPNPEQVPAAEQVTPASALTPGAQDYKTPEERRKIARARVAGLGVTPPSTSAGASMTLLGGGG